MSSQPSRIGVTIDPGRLDLVGAGEQRLVAQHRVEDQRLVGIGRVRRERRAVGEVHRDRPDLQPEARHLRAEAQQDALVGLDADRQEVRLGVRGRRPRTADAGRRGTGSRSPWRAWRAACRSAGRTARLTSASRRPRSLRGDERLGLRLRDRPPAPRGSPSRGCPPTQPAPYCPRTMSRATSCRVGGAIARSTLSFSSRRASASNVAGGSIATRLRSWSRWFWSMSRTAPGLLVERAALLDADRLGDGDLDVVDVAPVPERLEDPVRRTGRPSGSGRSPCPR